ncbi:beta-1,4-galactosyltransferase [Amylibacter ulvae]|uniref:Glycosyl transferase family 28 C-terminal domain-containing protein n=2 Tax=Paramylibacter TaxID=3143987 RepID=A0A2G5KB79_9RHOB|nr:MULTISPECIES: glycosyltransferase [Amylibacter]PIB26766.1 hypothetical protein BFP76_10965 [Amylibacter kogurei]GHA47733.1 beta-1,4-galactosyltransferase [Amylibacter ulvae]
MIFVTIGTMFPFDRLIQTMDAWAKDHPEQQVKCQIGTGSYIPEHMEYVRKYSQAEFSETVRTADLVVSHAGMGSVITAGRFGVPIVMIPRIKSKGEHTTDHQVATANWLRKKPGVFIADHHAELGGMVDYALINGEKGNELFTQYADSAFTDRLRDAILK